MTKIKIQKQLIKNVDKTNKKYSIDSVLLYFELGWAEMLFFFCFIELFLNHMFTIVVSIVSLTYDASITVTLKACVDKSVNRQRAVILYGIMYLSHMV